MSQKIKEKRWFLVSVLCVVFLVTGIVLGIGYSIARTASAATATFENIDESQAMAIGRYPWGGADYNPPDIHGSVGRGACIDPYSHTHPDATYTSSSYSPNDALKHVLVYEETHGMGAAFAYAVWEAVGCTPSDFKFFGPGPNEIPHAGVESSWTDAFYRNYNAAMACDISDYIVTVTEWTSSGSQSIITWNVSRRPTTTSSSITTTTTTITTTTTTTTSTTPPPPPTGSASFKIVKQVSGSGPSPDGLFTFNYEMRTSGGRTVKSGSLSLSGGQTSSVSYSGLLSDFPLSVHVSESGPTSSGDYNWTLASDQTVSVSAGSSQTITMTNTAIKKKYYARVAINKEVEANFDSPAGYQYRFDVNGVGTFYATTDATGIATTSAFEVDKYSLPSVTITEIGPQKSGRTQWGTYYTIGVDSKTYSTTISSCAEEGSTPPVTTCSTSSLNEVLLHTYFKVHKMTEDAGCDIVEGNSLYSLNGAEFTVYENGRYFATLKSGSDGWTPQQLVLLHPGQTRTFTIVETTPPSKGYRHDSPGRSYQLTVCESNSEYNCAFTNVQNIPVSDPIQIWIDKEWAA